MAPTSRSSARWTAAALVAVVSVALTQTQPALAQDKPGKPAMRRSELSPHLARLAKAPPEKRLELQRELVALGPRASAPLVAALSDKALDWETRAAVAWTLGELAVPSSKSGLEAVWEGAGEAPGTFRIQVASALGLLGDPAPLHTFVQPAATDKILLAKAAIQLANVRDKGAVELLGEHIEDEDVGIFVAIALGRLGDDRGKAALEAVIKDPVMRDYAAIALGMSGSETVRYQVRFALGNDDPFVRRDAVTVLKRLKDKASLERLSTMAKEDPDPRVRKEASRAVRTIKPRGRRK